MALFGRKKQQDDDSAQPAAGGNGARAGGDDGGTGAGGSGGGGGGDAPLEFSPEKAKKFFDYGAATFESAQYEYSMTLWLNGLRQDPSSISGLEGFLRSSVAFGDSKDGARGPSKDTLRQFNGKTGVDRYLAALLGWGAHVKDPYLAVKAMRVASDLGLPEPATWIAERAFKIALSDKKPGKDLFVEMMNVFHKFNKHELAVKAGEAAMRMDPADSRLANEVKNLAAESTMSRGGFDQPGQEGGFRANIRDAAGQKRMQEESSVAKTEETRDRLVASAKAEYDENPADRGSVRKYVRALLDRGSEADKQAAYDVLMRGYKDLGEFHFREQADELMMRIKRRPLQELKTAAEAPGAPADARQAYEKAHAELAAFEVNVFEAQVEAYPTDLAKKYELGRRYLLAGRFEDAIGQFQESRNDAKYRGRSLFLLGESFHRIGWNDEAVDTLRQALDANPQSETELSMEIRYALMLALGDKARENRDLAAAEEAYKIASSIAAEKINYRDIRVRRDECKKLVAELKEG